MVGILNEWSVISLQANQADRALFYLQQALIFDPDHPETHESLGAALAKLGLMEEAEKHKSLARRYRSENK